MAHTEADSWEDFGQKVDLTQRIREVLANYPEGTTILKELIQNADDSGATKVIVCLDRRQHGTEKLAYSGLAPFQGPALMVYNNSVFTEEDFESISRVGGSKKRTQAGKTGRFGIGFNVVYHLTDLPSFVSGQHLVYFDPHCAHLPRVSAANPGKRLDFVRVPAVDSQLDQFAPYKVFGCDMVKPFDGTLFRFPLRTADLAAVSRISRQSYSVQGMSELLSEFKAEAIPSLLFLKNVESIQLYDWPADAHAPSKLFTCQLLNKAPELHKHRQVFSELARSPLQKAPVSDVYRLDFRTVDEEQGSTETSESYLISQYMAGGDSSLGAIKARAEREYDLHLLPWTSLAARLQKEVSSSDFQGRAFCFLPLPMMTSLPIHVNGYFELSSNRRDLWLGLDMEGSGKLRSEWNRTLLSDACTSAYIQLLLQARGQLEPSSAFYYLFPANKWGDPWGILVTKLYQMLSNVPILHTRAVDGGSSNGRWMTPHQALYRDEEFARGAELTSALVSEGLPVVEPPSGVRQLLLELSAGANATVCTPAFVRAHLRAPGKHGALKKREDAMTLLEYCLEDVLDDEAGDHLVNLQLVPLSDGSLGKFGKASEAYVVLKGELEKRLLEQVPHRVVDPAVGGSLGDRLQSIAQSGSTNIRTLSAALLGSLLSEILPPEWQGEEHVAWEVLGANAELSASEQQQELSLFTQRDAALRAQKVRQMVVPLAKQASVNWLAAFWEWLGGHSHSDVRGEFLTWPLLPVSDGGLCQLSLSCAVIGWGWEGLESLASSEGAASNGGLKKVLKKLGCKFLHPGVIPESARSLASNSVHPPTAAGILQALSAASNSGGLVSQRVTKLDSSERALLRKFFTLPTWWSGGPGQPDSSGVNILKSLPIFGTFGKGALVALASNRLFLPPRDIEEALLEDSFLKPASDLEARILSGPLGVPTLGKAAFYRGHVFGCILGLPTDVRNRSMLAALRELPGLCFEDSNFREIMSRLPFVPAGGQDGQELLPPSALYDPRVEELVLLLEGGQSSSETKPPAQENGKEPVTSEPNSKQGVTSKSSGFFPAGEFASPVVLDALRFLGLKASVSQDTVLAAARAVEGIAASDPEIAQSRGRAILEYLEVHGQQWMPGAGEEVRKAFSKFGNYLGIKEARASESALERFWSDLGSTQWCPVMVAPPYGGLPWPTVTGTVSAPRFCRPASDTWLVSASLRILDGECRSAALARQMGWDKPPGPAVLAAQLLELGKRHARVSGRAVGRQLAAAIPRIYTLLHQLLGREEMEIVKAVLEGCSWVWVGDGFAPVDQVAFSGPLNLAPYFFVVPSDLSAFRELLSELGVREALAPGDYARALARMASDTSGRPLEDGQLSMAVWLVQQLADTLDAASSAIHVPDAAGVLAPAPELVYNDAPWLEGFGASDALAPSATASNSRFVHAKVSHEVAERIGVRSLRRLLLAANADSMDLAVGTAEAFGQHEALTVRLKHIVEMYADGPGILCELVQNADDAGATSVSIVLDREQYGTSSILSPRMATWQGPALLCYNDAQFTPRDLHNISRIGQDSKLEKPAAIGRFGLGFNSVYHLTDVPSFVSGGYLVIFDPHASHLPGVSPSHPGLKIGFVGRGLTQQFPDQFRPYVRFGCDLQHHFPGTLFRFPLRTPEAAKKSEIKQEFCDLNNLTELLYSFQSTATEALLFLRSVRSISVYIRDKASDSTQQSESLQLLYKVERAPSLSEDPQQAILNFIRGGGREVVSSKDAFLQRLQRASESALPGGCARVDIHTIQKTTTSADSSVHRPLTIQDQQIAAASLGESVNRPPSEDAHVSTSGQSWLVCNRLGGGRARAHALAPEARGRGFIPWAGIAARLDSQIEGRAFCFLPLPVANQLPVHVNGYFELSSNRRDIWQGSDHLGSRSNIKSEWNTCLLEDVAAPAYAQLLVEAAKQLGPTADFARLWPVGDHRDPWSRLTNKLYEATVDLPVLPTKAGGGLGRWITPRQAVFPDFSFPEMSNLGAALVAAGMPLVDVSPEVGVKFQEACPSLRYLTPQLLRRQLTIAGGRKPKLTDRKTILLALEYCLQGLDATSSAETLSGLPLLPLADGSLGTFGRPNEAPIFVATPEENELFANKTPHLFLEQTLLISEETAVKLGQLAKAGGTNLRALGPADVARILLPQFLPPTWQGQMEVEWRPNQEGLEGVSANQPSEAWIEGLWKWLLGKGLEGLSEWPLLPTRSGLLCKVLEIDPTPEAILSANWSQRMERYSNVIRGDAFSEGVAGLLTSAGCHLLRTDLVTADPVLNKFVHGSTARGVLGALSEAACRKGLPLADLLRTVTHAQRQETRAFLCQSKWFAENAETTEHLSTAHLRILASLPIFEAYTGGEATTADVNRLFVDLAGQQRFFPPPGVPESLLNDKLLRCENENEQTILSMHLGVKSIGRAAFYSDHVFGRPEPLATDVGRRAMLTVLRDLPSLTTEDPGFSDKLSRLAFVPTAAGNLAAPVDLYDPGVNELRMLLDAKAFFPSAEFQHPDVLDALRGLGLRRAMGRKGLIDSARSVEMKSGVNMSEAVEQGRALLQHLDDLESEAERKSASEEAEPKSASREASENAGTEIAESSSTGDDVEEGAFWSQLASVVWCPVLVEAPDEHLPWRSLGGPLAPSRFVRPKEDAWLVSSGLRLLDGEVKSANLKAKLGWGERPGANVLAGQLLELGRKYERIEGEGLEEVLRGAVLALYSSLQELIGSEEFEMVKTTLEGSNCVWVGNGFVAARSVAFDSPANFHPYLYTIPSELGAYRQLLEALEVRSRFAARDYAQLLFRMARDTQNEPLPEEQLNVVFRVLDALADDPAFVRGISVLLPDKSGRLCRAEDLVFNDAAWLAGEGESGPRLVHPDVQNEVAEKLGARSLRYLFLVDQEMTSDVPCPGLQLISAVSDDPKLVLFDLLEVADVAGARRVEFAMDGRDHPRQSLLQPNLAAFQGPALVVRLDGPPLSVQELSALFAPPPAKLRGRCCTYGSALLSCFSLTDLPFIASGGLLYMFDPRGEILSASLNGSKGSQSKPTGKAYSLEGTDLLKRFADQLEPLGLAENSRSSLRVTPGEGTVIRLPLRAASETHKSVREAVSFFQKHLASSMLFLKSVEDVRVTVQKPAEGSATQLLRCTILPQHVELRQPFQDQQKKRSKFAISSLFGGQSSVVRTNRIAVQTSRIGEAEPSLDEWLVVQALGSGKTRDLSLDRKYLSMNLVPIGGVAAHVLRNGMALPPSMHLEESEKKGGESENLAVKEEESDKGNEHEANGDVSSQEATNFPVESSSTDEDRSQDAAPFSNLSAPFQTPHASAMHSTGLPISGGEGLPVVIFGHFLPSRTTSGRQVFQRGVNAPAQGPPNPQQPSQDFLRLNWNRELLSCVREAYVELLHHLHRATNPHTTQPLRAPSGNGRVEAVMVPPMAPERLYSYWPKFAGTALTGQPDDSVLAESLVRPLDGLLAQMPLFVLQTGVRAKVGEGMFLAPPAVQERQGGVPPASVLKFLHQHYQVFAVPWEIRDELHGAGVSTTDLTPEMLRSLLRSPSAAVHHSPDPQEALVTQIDLLEYCCVDLVLKQDAGVPDENAASGSVPRVQELEREAAVRAQANELQRITRGGNSAGPSGGGRGASLVSGSAFASDIDRLFGAGSARAADGLVAVLAGAMNPEGGGTNAAAPQPAAPPPEVVRDADGNTVQIDVQKVTELIGIRCPSASGEMLRLGGEAFLATPQQEKLLPALASRFVHPLCQQRGGLSTLFSHPQFRAALNLKAFTPQLLAENLGSALPKVWAIRGTPLIVPWDRHPHTLPSAPSPDWLRMLWLEVGANQSAPAGGDLLASNRFGRWHLLPAVQGSRTVLIRGDQKALIFYPPEDLEDVGSQQQPVPDNLDAVEDESSENGEEEPLIDHRRQRAAPPAADVRNSGGDVSSSSSIGHASSGNGNAGSSNGDVSSRSGDVSEVSEQGVRYPKLAEARPWLLPLLQKIGAPLFDSRFRGVCELLVKPPPEKNLAQVLLAQLGALQQAGILNVANIVLAPPECESLLSLFATSFAPGRYSPADVTVLKSLPVYKAAHSSAYVSLSQGGPYCTVPPSMFLKPRDRVLEYNSEAIPLYKALDVRMLMDADVMAEHALPEFGARTREERDRTLGHLRTHWARLKQVPAVVAALKETRFVPSAKPPPDAFEATLHKPSELLDPSNELLRRVFDDEPERFAGGEFASERWLPILKDAGLRSSLDGSLYLECAKKIEARAKETIQRPSMQLLITEEERRFRRTHDEPIVSTNPAPNPGEVDRDLLETAGLLVEKMLGEIANVYGPAFCEAFSQIACVPAEKIDFKIVGGNRRTTEIRNVLASYAESIHSRDWPLAWSAAPVLKDERFVPPGFACGALKLRSPPAYSTVTAHLKILGQNGGEDVLARWGGITGARTAGSHVSVEDAYVAVFKFLDSKWDGLSHLERESLRGVPFVPVANGTRLVAPDRLYARARTDLAPFAFELPRVFTPYLRVLEGLGTRDAPTPEGLMKLIAQVAHTSGGERLNPTELHAVLRILTLAAEELASARSRAPAAHVSRVVVPDEGARLLTVHDVICADAAGASLLNEIDGRKVRLTHPLLPEEVAVRLGVRKLSESVEEELDQAWFPEQLPSLGGFTRDQVAARLQSPEFITAAIAVVHSHSAAIPSLRSITRRHLAATLINAASGLRLVNTLSTRLVLLPDRMDVTLRGESESETEDLHESNGIVETESQPLLSGTPSANGVLTAVKTSSLQQRTIYEFFDRRSGMLFVASPPPYLPLPDLFSGALSRLLGSPVTLPLGPLLFAPGGDVVPLCRALRVPLQEMTDEEGARQRDAQRSGAPGEKLLPQDLPLVQCHPLRPYHAGEVVACQTENGVLRYGRVAEDVRAPSGQALYHVAVETSPGHVTELLSSSVFSFRSASAVDGSSAAREAVDERRALRSDVGSSSSDVGTSRAGNGNVGSLSSDVGTLTAGTGSLPAVARTLQQVKPSEVVQAVHDMLAAADLPLGLEEGALMERALGLQEQLGAAEALLEGAERRVAEVQGEVEAAKSAWTCKVCLGEEVTSALVPCGHLFCNTCSAGLGGRCPFCRRPASSILRIYKP